MFKIDLNALFWSVAAFIIASSCFIFLYDDSYDGLANNLSVGQFSPFSLMDWHYLGIIWVKEIFMFLQDSFPSINVFFSICLGLNLISIYYLYVTLNRIFENRSASLKWIIQIAFLLLAVDALIFITHTRFATLFAGLALFNLAYFHSQSRVKIVFHCLVFLFGFLVRPESGVGALLFVIPGLFFQGQPILRLLKVSILPISCSLLFFVTLETHKLFTDRLEILIEPDIEYAMSTDKFIPFKGGNEKDSVRYVFARNGFFIDTSFVDHKYLSSIISKTNRIDFEKYKKSANHVSQFYVFYSITTYTLIFILICLLFSEQYKAFIKVLIYNFGLFLIFIVLDYHVNIADRHFSSLIILSILVSTVFLEKRAVNNKINLINVLFIILLKFPIENTYTYINLNNIYVQNKVNSNVKTLNEFEKKIQGRNVVVMLLVFNLFDKPYSFINSKRTKNNYFIYDLFTYSIVPRYTSYLSSKCNCDANVPLSFFIWLEKTNAILIIDEKRSLILRDYFRVRFNKKIEFNDVQKLNHIIDTKLWPHLKFKTVHFFK